MPKKRLLHSCVGFRFDSWDCAKHVRVRAGPPLSGQRLDVVSCYFTFLHSLVGVSSSVWWFKNRNWCLYLSHAMLVLAELIVCSTRGFACILAKWFWPVVMSLSLTYGSPEASCNKRAYTYFGRRSASLMIEFWTLYFGDGSF